MDTQKIQKEEEQEPELSKLEKLVQLNKLGGLCLAGGSNVKAIAILQKTMNYYLEMKEKNEIPFFYGNLYCNLAKAYSVDRKFDEAEKLYIELIENHPFRRLLILFKDSIKEKFLIDVEELLNFNVINSYNVENNEQVYLKHKVLLSYFNINEEKRPVFEAKAKFHKNNLNSLSSFSDSLINLAVILQIKHKESFNAFNMYYFSILIDPDNNVANIDYNNFLRENNLKALSDEFITTRINFDNKDNKCKETIKQLRANGWKHNVNDISFVCMKWGNKYGAEYVNKLFNGISKNIKDKKFDFWCITENSNELNSNIKVLPLTCDFKGWMKKSYLFSSEVVKNFSKRICFIDLDMIVYNDISYLIDYDGDFCLMSTNDIQCENSKDGYNSSIILWRNGYGEYIFDFLKAYHEYIVKQVIRFDHYLEFIIKNVDFVQEEFKSQVLDYNTYCKDKQILPEAGSIIAFPRYPKPHECKEDWVNLHWK